MDMFLCGKSMNNSSKIPASKWLLWDVGKNGSVLGGCIDSALTIVRKEREKEGGSFCRFCETGLINLRRASYSSTDWLTTRGRGPAFLPLSIACSSDVSLMGLSRRHFHVIDWKSLLVRSVAAMNFYLIWLRRIVIFTGLRPPWKIVYQLPHLFRLLRRKCESAKWEITPGRMELLQLLKSGFLPRSSVLYALFTVRLNMSKQFTINRSIWANVIGHVINVTMFHHRQPPFVRTRIPYMIR